jgi:hypothetical protein
MACTFNHNSSDLGIKDKILASEFNAVPSCCSLINLTAILRLFSRPLLPWVRHFDQSLPFLRQFYSQPRRSSHLYRGGAMNIRANAVKLFACSATIADYADGWVLSSMKHSRDHSTDSCLELSMDQLLISIDALLWIMAIVVIVITLLLLFNVLI